jgi:hypothetical protein
VMGEGMPKDAASFKKKATKMKKAAENWTIDLTFH